MTKSQHTSDPAAQLYEGASGSEYHDGKRELRSDALDWVMHLRAEKFQQHVKPGDVVLEFGVGSGWNLGRLRCGRRIGCDTSELLRERVTALGIEFIRELGALAAGTADVVICHHALEHVLEPAQTLKQLQQVLKPEGKLILHVPWERELRYSRHESGEPNHHLYTWNAQNLGNLLTVLGYSIHTIGVRRYGYDRYAANLAGRLHVNQSGFRLIRRLLITLRPLFEVECVATVVR